MFFYTLNMNESCKFFFLRFFGARIFYDSNNLCLLKLKKLSLYCNSQQKAKNEKTLIYGTDLYKAKFSKKMEEEITNDHKNSKSVEKG